MNIWIPVALIAVGFVVATIVSKLFWPVVIIGGGFLLWKKFKNK